MSSDDAYMSFLDKANADLNAGRCQAQQQGATDTARTETVDVNTQIPAPLQSIDAYYVSDSDEPFEPVALRWDGASKGDWPSAGTCIPSAEGFWERVCLARLKGSCMAGEMGTAWMDPFYQYHLFIYPLGKRDKIQEDSFYYLPIYP
jgi:hypothetical protein